jgi:hypothetical protein
VQNYVVAYLRVMSDVRMAHDVTISTDDSVAKMPRVDRHVVANDRVVTDDDCVSRFFSRIYLIGIFGRATDRTVMTDEYVSTDYD